MAFDVLKQHRSNRYLRSFKRSILLALRLTAVMMAASELAGPAQASVLYWDTDGSNAGNNATNGAGLGGTGSWNLTDANWWNAGTGALQVWRDGTDVVFWGTAGAVTVATVSASNILFRTTGYALNSGTLTMVGAPSSFNVEAGVTAVIGSTLAGSNTLVKVGAGTLVLSNPANLNTATNTAGGWRIEGGTLRISADGSLGAPLPDSARNSI